MMSPATNRTPISILQEICAKRGLTPKYELISNEGQNHDPVYVYQCTAGNVSIMARGSSKKKAKHQSSYLVILQLIGQNPETQHEKNALRDLRFAAASQPELYSHPVFENEIMVGISDLPIADDKNNSVGELQELCQKNMWPPPIYEFTECLPSLDDGSKYKCTVKLWKWELSGFGVSKKESKRKAAADLFKEIIINDLSIPPEALEAMEEENLPLVEKNDLSNLRDKKTNLEIAAKCARKLLSGVFISSGKLPKISSISPESKFDDIYPILDELTERHKLNISYSYMNSTKSGKTYCQAQLSTIPPQVICSRGAEKFEEARKDAAYRCLVYLKTMTMPAPRLDEAAWFRELP